MSVEEFDYSNFYNRCLNCPFKLRGSSSLFVVKCSKVKSAKGYFQSIYTIENCPLGMSLFGAYMDVNHQLSLNF